jgi:phosphoserine phosphatase RsbU/P
LNVQLHEDNIRMGAELNVVKQLQQMILPRPEELRNIPGIEIAGYMQPADEVAAIITMCSMMTTCFISASAT